jgi:small subunit ribosomal protein S8
VKYLELKKLVGKIRKEDGLMNITDPIADMLTRIRNANNVNKDVVDIPASNLKINIAKTLKDEGFIKEYKIIDNYPQNKIRIYLKYGRNDEKVITGLKRISKPGLRVYVNKDEIPRVLGGLGIAVISTSRGILTDKQARNEGIGGEVLCYVW